MPNETGVRAATHDDAPESVRLARVMFASMGSDLSDPTWEHEGLELVKRRLGDDLAIFVVDHPSEPGRLIASAAGTIAERLPTPRNPDGLAGYVQWVCTDGDYRGQGLGRAVMTALLDWYESRGVHNVELHATPDGEPLYRSLGFGETNGLPLRRQT